ncbi:hypothetical protein ACE1BH_16960 [Aeromonas jandaei]
MVLNLKIATLILVLPLMFSCKQDIDTNVIWGKWSCAFVTIKGPALRGEMLFNKDETFSWRLFLESNNSLEINEKGKFSITDKLLVIDITQSDFKNSGRTTPQTESLIKDLKAGFHASRKDEFNIKMLTQESLQFFQDGTNGSVFQCKRSR